MLLAACAKAEGLDVSAAAFKFGFDLAALDKNEGHTLAAAFSALVYLVKTGIVVIIDEVQHAMGSEHGNNMLLALKAVGAEAIQKIANLLVESNILARDGHGICGANDPFVADTPSSIALQ